MVTTARAPASGAAAPAGPRAPRAAAARARQQQLAQQPGTAAPPALRLQGRHARPRNSSEARTRR